MGSLSRHVKTHSSEKTFPCPTCGKLFVDSAHVQRHLKTHLGEKPFSCEVCNQRFTVKSSLKVHMRIHEGIKPHSVRYVENVLHKRIVW
jgi:KRAB domain-containing zinc finger protein